MEFHYVLGDAKLGGDLLVAQALGQLRKISISRAGSSSKTGESACSKRGVTRQVLHYARIH